MHAECKDGACAERQCVIHYEGSAALLSLILRCGCRIKMHVAHVFRTPLTAVAAEAEGHAGAHAEGVPHHRTLLQHRQHAAHDRSSGTCAMHLD